MDTAVLSALSLALGLGLLIGLQRERAGSHLGGIRTFPLIALLGAFCGLLAYEYDYGALVVAAGFGGVAVLAILANLRTEKGGEDTPGQTSEAAALLTYALGVLLATGHYAAAIVAGGVTAVLLHSKQPLHEFAGDLKERDVQAIMRFVIISLIILPLLPNKAYGPYELLNPREIWFMVVLIVMIFVVSSDPPIALFTLFCLYALSGYAFWAWRWFRGEPNPAKPLARDTDRSG